tara:strand:- start:340 stop:549 length:210 start_codon:yes stop_codon:yes gene_type:complete
MDANTLIFGSMAVISLAAFFYLGKFKASPKQTERDDRINWSSGKYSFFKYILLGMGIVLGISLLIKYVF